MCAAVCTAAQQVADRGRPCKVLTGCWWSGCDFVTGSYKQWFLYVNGKLLILLVTSKDRFFLFS
jgi:hypothetical protein